MQVKFWRMAAAGAGLSTLLMTSVVVAPGVASAATGVAFSSASFHGYASGDEIHLGALGGITGSDLATVDEAYSSSTTNTAGLTAAVSDPEISGATLQPSQAASVRAYGQGSPLAVALNGDKVATLYGQAAAVAPPNGAKVSKSISLPSQLAPLLSASALTSNAAAYYSADSCPIGQPLSYGYGSLATTSVLPMAGILSNPVVSTPASANDPNGVANSASFDYLSPNSDGTFGLSSTVEESVAPVSINLLDLFQIGITVQGSSPSSPLSLTADAPGEGTAAVKLSNADAVNITLTALGQTYPIATVPVSAFGPNGVTVPIGTGLLTGLTSLTGDLTTVAQNTSGAVGTALQALKPVLTPILGAVTTVTSAVQTVATDLLGSIKTNISLGTIQVGILNSTHTGGTAASGTFDLAKVNLSLDGTTLGGVSLPSQLTKIDLSDVYLGHMAVSATNASPISCTIPMTKTSDPTSVSAGQSFTSNIFVPQPSDAIACHLTGLKVTDTITDYQGSPTFTATSASNGGVVKTVSPTEAVVTWSSLSWSPGDPPLDLQVHVTVPGASPAGVIQDTATSSAVTSACTGGASGVTGLDSAVTLTGAAHLAQPSVRAVGTAAATSAPKAAAPTALPFTGAMGGLWQPFAGLGMFGAGVGGLTLLRRARRLRG